MGIQKDNAERAWEEKMHDQEMKLGCLKLVMEFGHENNKSMPWNFAQKLYLWVKYNNPDMEVK